MSQQAVRVYAIHILLIYAHKTPSVYRIFIHFCPTCSTILYVQYKVTNTMFYIQYTAYFAVQCLPVFDGYLLLTICSFESTFLAKNCIEADANSTSCDLKHEFNRGKKKVMFQ